MTAHQHIKAWIACGLLLFSLGGLIGCRSVSPDSLDLKDGLREDSSSTSKAQIYTLRAGDEIRVDVFREPDVSGTFEISPDGTIRHPLLGDVFIEGLSLSIAESMMRRKLGEKYLIDPQVTITLEASESSEILLMGEVVTPGSYPFPGSGKLSLLEAIARAGGFTELASPNRVRVIRETNGKPTRMRVRVADMLAGKKNESDLYLKPGDVVVIPEIRF